MKIVLVTGSAGLIGAEAARFFARKGLMPIGLDNNMRRVFFGAEASTDWSRRQLESDLTNYKHYAVDIRDKSNVDRIFAEYSSDIAVVIHTAAQPSHDWAATQPFVDFTINANGTLNLLEATRQFSPNAAFIFTSTNKVYGDRPNDLPLIEQETRWEVDPAHRFASHGIDESMPVDQCKHSLFGVSKLAGDLLVQEYGRYFGMKTACLRGGCLTGPGHSGTQLHGFLSYLMRCAVTKRRYQIFGYKGKQVRDNIHSYDLVSMFWHYCQNPRVGEVYNVGGGRSSNCSLLEAISLCEQISGNKVSWTYVDSPRSGDHIWYISDIRRFQSHYPEWKYEHTLESTLKAIYQASCERIEVVSADR